MNEVLELTAGGTLIVCAIAFARVAVASLRVRAGNLWRSICDACGYSTEGLVHTCPECGDYVRPAHLRTIDSSGVATDGGSWRITAALLAYAVMLTAGCGLLARSMESFAGVTRSAATVRLTPTSSYYPTWRSATITSDAWRPSPQIMSLPADRATIVIYTNATSTLTIEASRTAIGWNLTAGDQRGTIPRDPDEYTPLLDFVKSAARNAAQRSGLSSNDPNNDALAAGVQETLGAMHTDAAATRAGPIPLGGVGPNRVQANSAGTGRTTFGAPALLVQAICVAWFAGLVIGGLYIARSPRATAPGSLITPHVPVPDDAVGNG